MGTKTVKKAAKLIIEKYYSRLTYDFQVNKRITDEVARIPSKRMRNKIAGFITHLMRRIQHGTVRGISIKLQEEERERNDYWTAQTKQLAHSWISPTTKCPGQRHSSSFPNKQLRNLPIPAKHKHPLHRDRDHLHILHAPIDSYQSRLWVTHGCTPCAFRACPLQILPEGRSPAVSSIPLPM